MQIIRFFRVKPERFIVYDNQTVYDNPVQMCGNFMRDQFFHFAKGTHVNFFFVFLILLGQYCLILKEVFDMSSWLVWSNFWLKENEQIKDLQHDTWNIQRNYDLHQSPYLLQLFENAAFFLFLLLGSLLLLLLFVFTCLVIHALKYIYTSIILGFS